MATHQSLSSTIRLQTGMSMRELAAIWQVSPSTLTLSLQGKRPRPVGLTECLAVATVPLPTVDGLLQPQDLAGSLPEIPMNVSTPLPFEQARSTNGYLGIPYDK